MKLNNDYVNVSEVASNLSREFGQFEPSEENALRLLFQRATNASTAAQMSQSLTNRLRAMGYDQFAVRFDSSGISIIDGGPLEAALDAWVTQEGGRAEEAAHEIRNTFYNNRKHLFLINFFLRTLPPILQLLDLTQLRLSGNQLTTFDATRLTNLGFLDLSGNQLTTFDATGLTNLRTLSLSGNQLTAFDATQLDNLIDLLITGNQLTTFDATGLTNLAILDLSGNQLTTFDPTELTNLRTLYLSRNRLTTFDSSGLVNLATLCLSGNQLITFDVAGLVNLIDLDLANNEQLSNLPLALCQCTNLIRINRLGTQIPDHNCDTILAQCRALRDPGANPVLRTQLRTWTSASRENFKLDFILEMTDEEKGVIHEWLTRLERTKDFTTNSQPALAKEVCSMLRDLELHPVFRESFFAQVPANNEACEDRAGMAFNELFVSWRLATLPQNATEKEKLQLLVQPAKTFALRKALARTISSHGGNEAESVEIYLYYEKELKQRLQLLTAINNMRYTTIGWRDWIKEEELVATVNSTYIDELCELPQLKELALKDPEFAEQYHAMNEKFTGMLENLGGGISSQVYLVGSEEVSRKRAEYERELLRKWAIPKLAS